MRRKLLIHAILLDSDFFFMDNQLLVKKIFSFSLRLTFVGCHVGRRVHDAQMGILFARFKFRNRLSLGRRITHKTAPEGAHKFLLFLN